MSRDQSSSWTHDLRFSLKIRVVVGHPLCSASAEGNLLLQKDNHSLLWQHQEESNIGQAHTREQHKKSCWIEGMLEERDTPCNQWVHKKEKNTSTLAIGTTIILASTTPANCRDKDVKRMLKDKSLCIVQGQRKFLGLMQWHRYNNLMLTKCLN